ncbi:MAG: hypothetical protein WAK19_15355 [Candidatus Cybelea sp.]
MSDDEPITDDEFAFMEDFAERFKRSIEHVISNLPEDDFDDYLSSWAVNLGVLAYDVLSSCITLLKLNHIRAAYMLQRPLLDYHLRLRYYIIQSKEPRQKWITKGKRNTKNYLAQCHAYKDWKNAEDKIYDIMKKQGASALARIPENERRKTQAKLQKNRKVLARRISHMCEVTANETLGSLYLENQILSAHLHGDQVTIIDTIRGGDIAKGTLSVFWHSEGFKPYIILANLFAYGYEIMVSIEMIRGWCYAKDSSFSEGFIRMLRRRG